MRYHNVIPAVFRERPNRFLAICEIGKTTQTVHVKNTGRCRELLLPGTTVYLEPAADPDRKTRYSLIAVQKGERLINMDSQAPNAAVREALESGLDLFGMGMPDRIRPETTLGDSRFDFSLVYGETTTYLEVKGVTLEEDGIVLFPDAPTERGLKHLRELTGLAEDGIPVGVLFLVQMEDVRFFTPNRKTHPAFAEALIQARNAGVHIFCYDCRVTPGEMILSKPVPVRLNREEAEK